MGVSKQGQGLHPWTPPKARLWNPLIRVLEERANLPSHFHGIFPRTVRSSYPSLPKTCLMGYKGEPLAGGQGAAPLGLACLNPQPTPLE